MRKSVSNKVPFLFLSLLVLFSLRANGHFKADSTVNGYEVTSLKAETIDHEDLAYTDTLTVLFIGNSFTQRDNIPGLIQQLAADGIPKLFFDLHTQIYPGRSLENHWELGTHHFIKRASLTIEEQEALIVRLEELVAMNSDQFYKNALSRHNALLNDLKNQVKFRKWDIVVLQSWRDDMEGSLSKYLIWAPKFAELVSAQGGKVVLYETTPSAVNGTTTIPGILNQFPLTVSPTEAQRNTVIQKAKMMAGLATQLNASVVPMSSVVLRCQTDRPDITLRYVNDFHPNQIGSYLGACTFYGVLFGRSPVGLSLDRVKSTTSLSTNPNLDLDGNPITKIFSDTDRLDLQRIAWDGITDFNNYTTTGIKNVKGNVSMDIFPNPSNGLIKLKFKVSEMVDNKPLNISLINLEGRVVYSKPYNSSEFGEAIIDVSSIPSAFYLLRVETVEDFIVAKIMVNN